MLTPTTPIQRHETPNTPSSLPSLTLTHGLLTSLSTIFLFPLAAILLRTLHPFHPTHPKPVTTHRIIQWFGWVVFIVGAVVGVVAAAVEMVGIGDEEEEKEGSGWNAHVALGGILLCLVVGQVVWGEMHHRRGKAMESGREQQGGKDGKKIGRKLVTRLHVWGGRAVILVGMINGGLGLHLTGQALSRGDSKHMIGVVAYSVTAGTMGLWYLWAMVKFEKRQIRERKLAAEAESWVMHSIQDAEGNSGNPDRERQLRQAQHRNVARLGASDVVQDGDRPAFH